MTLALALPTGCTAVNDFGRFDFSGDAGAPDGGAASCDDGVANGGETDVDCGGPDCDPCAGGQGCAEGSDCASGFCGADGTCAEPSCTDGAANGDETDVDCGGPDCDPCADGRSCAEGDDCLSGACEGGTCIASGCTDGIQNGDETDVDCGGGTCPGCEGGGSCEDGDDCRSTVCDAGACTTSACDDGLLNGDESDEDCGGPECDPCADGLMCSGPDDCDSGRCDDGVCGSCSDGERNGDESDVDCGGATCRGCGHGDTCGGDMDCGGTCADDGTCRSNGHAVLIGHDLFRRDETAEALLWNAITLSDEPRELVIALYTEYADTSGEVPHVEAAIMDAAMAAGRAVSLSRVTSRFAARDAIDGAEPTDVLIFLEQETATDPASLRPAASTLRGAMNEFLDRGGVVIGMNHVDAGWVLMDVPGLFGVEGTTNASRDPLTIEAPGDPLATGLSDYAGPNGTGAYQRLFGGRTVVATATPTPVVQHLVRRRVMFLGYATWDQDARTQSDREQDRLMDAACDESFSGSRAATTDELRARLIDGLPPNNTSSRYLIPAMPRGAGDDNTEMVDGHARNCVDPGDDWPSGTGTWTGNTNCFSSTRSAICVR
ncbi:MAG TPA: hypothetical protein RMH99_09715 [Sandaracinaceae bacterium LLY-WYZ-13_1]|nr:hypothetical protein [Sandaracinaceae bacterium LLY-WYZ-13_1]